MVLRPKSHAEVVNRGKNGGRAACLALSGEGRGGRGKGEEGREGKGRGRE
jgi:hypothetical protein